MILQNFSLHLNMLYVFTTIENDIVVNQASLYFAAIFHAEKISNLFDMHVGF